MKKIIFEVGFKYFFYIRGRAILTLMKYGTDPFGSGSGSAALVEVLIEWSFKSQLSQLIVYSLDVITLITENLYHPSEAFFDALGCIKS